SHSGPHRNRPPFPTRRSSDLEPSEPGTGEFLIGQPRCRVADTAGRPATPRGHGAGRPGLLGAFLKRGQQQSGDLGPLAVAEEDRSEEHTSELQSLAYLVCRLL